MRPTYTGACVLGMLGNVSGICSDIADLRSMLSSVVESLDGPLQGLTAARPTMQAIEAGRCAVDCLCETVEQACSFHAKVSGASHC